eukprot:352945-Chlamydomonas_euryale.AAC.7
MVRPINNHPGVRQAVDLKLDLVIVGQVLVSVDAAICRLAHGPGRVLVEAHSASGPAPRARPA